MNANTDLHQAAANGDNKLLEILLAGGADVNSVDDSGYTPLHRAIKSPKAGVETLKLLVDKGADFRRTIQISFPDGEAYMLHGLSLSIKHLSLGKTRFFLDAGADINYVRDGGFDALIDAAYTEARGPDAEARLSSMLEFLMKKGVPLTGRTRKGGRTALMLLSGGLHLDAVHLLLRAGADEAQLEWTPLHKAVAFGTMKDVAARLDQGDALEAKDHAERTPMVLAAQMGDVRKVEILWKRGADRKARWRSFSLLNLAISHKYQELIEWLVSNGADVNEEDDFGAPLRKAVMYSDHKTAKILLAAGANVHKQGKYGASALNDADDVAMIRLLLDAGADTGTLSNNGRRILLGFPSDPDPAFLTATPEEYARAKHPREGRSNPEEVDEPFWLGMIRSGIDAYNAKKKYADESAPVWCAQRFGQSLTFLPDGRIILIAGEHEDSYDQDFHIYNDVFVLEPGGRLRIFLYPESEFPPTDGHSATLDRDSIYIIGNVGYQETRRPGFTPVYKLDTKTLRMEPVKTSGDGPGWIGRHRAALKGDEIEITGGEISSTGDDFGNNSKIFRLNLRTMVWRDYPQG